MKKPNSTNSMKLLYKFGLLLCFCFSMFHTSLSAQQMVPFQCEPAFYQVISGQLTQFNPNNGEFTPIGPVNATYNSIGYNTEDNFIYGIDASTNNLVKIDANGTRFDLGSIAGLPAQIYIVGDFDLSGNLYLYNSFMLYKIDVDATPLTATAVSVNRSIQADMAYNVIDEHFYNTSTTLLKKLNPTTGFVSTTALTGPITGESGVFGSFWSTNDGQIYAANNASGNIYKIDPNTAISTFFSNGIVTNSNDGAGCPLASEPVGNDCANSTLDGIINSTVTSCDVSNNGTAVISPFNGVPPYTYLWNDPAGQTTKTATGLDAGDYTVIVTDDAGCTISQTVEVELSQEGIWIDFVRTDASCNVSDGSVELEVTLGTPPYIFQWSNGATTINNTDLSPGEYCVTVSDQAGCAVNQCFTIFEDALEIEVGVTNSTCEVSNDGKASVNNIENGQSPYSFLWDDGQTFVVAYDLSAGPHSVTVTDANGCTAVENFEVELSPEGVWIMITTTPTDCGGASGTAYAGAMSGVEPYVYLWDDGQTTPTATGLSAGEHCVMVTDANGCSNTECATVDSDNILNVTVSTTDVGCNTGADDGTASATVNNGNSPFTYIWSNGETTASIDGLAAGTYEVTVEDVNGCSGTASGTVNSTTPPNGGDIATNDPTTICIDGNPDPINVSLTGATGTNSQWVITDANGVILALPAGPPFDLDGAGPGVCLIWHLSFEDGLMGAMVGN
ncbi:MAG: hypothetical protein AB8G15_07150, partial [Saprospiraceae bacterium]